MSAMNLGDSNLKYVNTSRPLLVHTDSKQSITASDDYYSLTSEASSNDDRTTDIRYETPPMHMHHEYKETAESEATIPAIKPVKQKDGNGNGQGGPAGHISEDDATKRKPVSSSSSVGTVIRRPMSETSPPTPGVDDTPYIQFAIEQLTRDEEITGPRRQSHGSEANYPVERIIPNQYGDKRNPGPPAIPTSDNPRILSAEKYPPSIEPPAETSRYYTNDKIWRWTTVQPIAWLLFALYVLLILGLCALFFRFRRGETGLKWDPTSLADIITIFHRSNILDDFEGSEVQNKSMARSPKDVRLGYWRDSKHENETFYCLGDENAPIRRYSLERGKMRPIKDHPPLDIEGQKSAYNALRSDIHNPSLRYRWVPWFLKDTFVVAWIVITFVLLIAFLVASFVNDAVERGFPPQLSSPTGRDGFSPADFLYSFIPSLLGMILFLAWQPIDTYFRALQPFASLAERHGTCADKSLLLDYTACLPLEASFKALVNGHYRVAWISLLGIMSIALPILAGGIFTAQFVPSDQEVLMVASMPGYKALVVFLVIYVLSFLATFPRRKRYLPHDISTLAEIVSFFYQSPLLAEATFREPRSKIDLVTKLLSSPVQEKISPRFAFGVYMGRDGREHLGIDRWERPGYGEMLVDIR
ncbi:MAG: hypothetical protein Q9163_002356 [Psora crenata]